MDNKIKFYQTDWFMWLTLIFFAPLGIFLMWKKNKFKKAPRIALSIIFGLIFIIALGVNGADNTKDNNLASDKNKSETTVSTVNQEPQKKEETKKSEDEKSETANTSVNGELKIHFIDVGQADSILIQQGTQSMLIDAGNNDDDKTVKNYLDAQGVKELTYVIGTHAHEDHIGGLDYIINSLKVGKVYFPKQTATTKTFKDFIGAVKGKGLKLTEPKVGESFNLGEAKCTILAPNGSSYEDANDYSIVIKVVFGDTSFLLTGDAEAVSEMEMVKAGADLKANVLKVGHHGSKSSTCANFLDTVNPQYAVISVGKDNEYGHPVQSTMDRLKDKDVKVYRTDEQGTIIVTSNGKEIKFDKDPGSYTGKGGGESNSNNNSGGTSGSESTSSGSTGGSTSSTPSQPTTTPVTPPATSGNDNTVVYKTKSGECYHMDGCKSLSKSKIQTTVKDAKAAGLRPCNNCHPPQ